MLLFIEMGALLNRLDSGVMGMDRLDRAGCRKFRHLVPELLGTGFMIARGNRLFRIRRFAGCGLVTIRFLLPGPLAGRCCLGMGASGRSGGGCRKGSGVPFIGGLLIGDGRMMRLLDNRFRLMMGGNLFVVPVAVTLVLRRLFHCVTMTSRDRLDGMIGLDGRMNPFRLCRMLVSGMCLRLGLFGDRFFMICGRLFEVDAASGSSAGTSST